MFQKIYINFVVSNGIRMLLIIIKEIIYIVRPLVAQIRNKVFKYNEKKYEPYFHLIITIKKNFTTNENFTD